MAAEPIVSGEIDMTASNRPVWVINTHTETYEEEFRGKVRRVPPNGEKSLVMRYLEARKFLGRPKSAGHRNTFGQYVLGPKALKVVEMTAEEAAQWYGVDTKTLMEEDKKTQEKKSKKHVCHLDGKEFPSKKALEAYMKATYPNHQPLEDKKPSESKKEK